MKITLHRRIFAVAAVTFGVIAVTVIYSTFDPMQPWFPKCLFRQLTGLDCPGCGSQRALHAMLSGDITSAFHYNPLIFILLPVIAILLLCELWPDRTARLYRVLHTRTFILTIAAVIAAWWIVRNII